MIETMMFFYAAGTDTSKATSTSMLYYLSKHANIRKSLEHEILQNLLGGDWNSLKKNPTKEINWDDS